jgi:hypothetical protein
MVDGNPRENPLVFVYASAARLGVRGRRQERAEKACFDKISNRQ